jgi:ectoine hydroxylase-related dioxygenase (phytanoyl-CoA dioxygenase family)
MIDIDLTDLKTRGYAVVKNFLTDLEIQQQLQDYETQKNNQSGQVKIKNYSLLKAGREHNLTDKIKRLLDSIAQQTDISVDLVGPTGMYFDTQLANIGWHQDHESYYVWQTGYHQINFWIPLIKPCSTTSGLCVVPMDTLKTHIGDLFEQRLLDQGAKRFNPTGNVTRVIDDEYGDEFDLSINIEHIAVAPEMQAGDVLLVRGDVIHATQDSDTNRVALAIRAVDGNRTVDRARFQQQCNMKKFVLEANPSNKKIINHFAAGNNQFVIHDFYKGRI